MANVKEIETWEPGIYQLETTDPVMGGEDGIDNLQAKQLANRTLYLKKQIETVCNSIPAVPVQSVNGKTGDVELSAADVGTLTEQQLRARFLPANLKPGNQPIYEVGEQVDFKKLAINGQQISRFIVANGSNVNGWYEIYSDGFKRVGNKWPAANPLYSPNPSGCVKIPFPISFTRAVMSVNVSIETTTPAVEIINYEISGLHEIGLTAGMYGVSGMVGMSEFACSYIAEGY